MRFNIIPVLLASLLAVAGFLFLSYFNNFVTRAEFSEVHVIKNDIEHIKETQYEIKDMLSKIQSSLR